jgi:membrane associated rhomboid family serine protease
LVLPVHDVNPLRRTPWVTYLLVAANVVVFLITPAAPSTVTGTLDAVRVCRQVAFYDEYAAIPRELTTNHPLTRVATGRLAGTRSGEVGCQAGRPSYDKIPILSVLFAMFLHGGWLHLLGNMLFLLVFGNNVEDRFGRFRFLFFYLFCGYVATYGFALFQPDSRETLIGASGAIAGVLGAYLALFPRARVWSLLTFAFFIPIKLPAWLVLGTWFLLQWAYSAGLAASSAGGVAYLAHVVGFVAGLLIGLLARRPDSYVMTPRPRG